jgi:hypothetical protein
MMIQPRVGETRRQVSWTVWSGVLAAAAVILTAGCDRGTQSATAAPADGRHGGSGPAAIAVSAAAAVTKPMAVKLKCAPR